MLSRKAILVFLLFISHQFAAQSIELFGEAKPGGLLIGKAPDAAQVMLDNKIIKLST